MEMDKMTLKTKLDHEVRPLLGYIHVLDHNIQTSCHTGEPRLFRAHLHVILRDGIARRKAFHESMVPVVPGELAASTLVTSVCRVDVSIDMTYGAAIILLLIYFFFVYIDLVSFHF